MKIKEEKHNHKLTNILKVFIFSVLMLLPFINVGVRCAYVTFNKNAYQNYSGNEEITTTYVNTNSQFKVNNSYYFNSSNYQDITNIDFGGNERRIVFDNIRNIVTNLTNDLSNLKQLGFYKSPNANSYYYYGYDSNGNAVFGGTSSTSNFVRFEFDFISSNLLDIVLNQNLFYYQSNQNYNYIDNVFEYSLNKLEEEQYLTWTQNTAVYQGVNAMTTGLGITQAVIPMLIVYWFMLTIIYVIIDIVLALFTKLTHMIGNKTT